MRKLELFCDVLMVVSALLLGVLIALLFLPIVPVHSHETGTPFADWFNSLKQPDNPPASCCGEGDQYYVDSYMERDDGSFVAQVGTHRIEVPAKKVNWNDVNPTGRGVIFTSIPKVGENGVVYCFIPAVGM